MFFLLLSFWDNALNQHFQKIIADHTFQCDNKNHNWECVYKKPLNKFIFYWEYFFNINNLSMTKTPTKYSKM